MTVSPTIAWNDIIDKDAYLEEARKLITKGGELGLYIVRRCYDNDHGKLRQKAYDIIRSEAEHGNTIAMIYLGTRVTHYLNGIQHENEPIYWIEKAIETGDTSAIFILANAYIKGVTYYDGCKERKTRKNKAKAIHLWKCATKQGKYHGFEHLAKYYHENRQYDKAIKCYEKLKSYPPIPAYREEAEYIEELDKKIEDCRFLLSRKNDELKMIKEREKAIEAIGDAIEKASNENDELKRKKAIDAIVDAVINVNTKYPIHKRWLPKR